MFSFLTVSPDGELRTQCNPVFGAGDASCSLCGVKLNGPLTLSAAFGKTFGKGFFPSLP